MTREEGGKMGDGFLGGLQKLKNKKQKEDWMEIGELEIEVYDGGFSRRRD